MNDEPLLWSANPALALASLMAQPTGVRYVYRHRFRCPSCHCVWVLEVAAPRGHVNPKPDPVRMGMACLCGRCEARRKARTVSDGAKPQRPGQGGKFGLPWAEEDDRKVWGLLRHHTSDYVPLVERLPEPWDESPLRDYKKAEMDRIFIRHDGRIASVLSEAALLCLKLDWRSVDATAFSSFD